MSAHSFGGTPRFSIRDLAFIPRGLMRGVFTSVVLGPLVFCGGLGFSDPNYLQNPYWIGGAVAGLAFLVLVLRWFGGGRGILRGFALALFSLGFMESMRIPGVPWNG